MCEALVYGTGMIAKAFIATNLPDNVVFIAAGVSNSQETCILEQHMRNLYFGAASGTLWHHRLYIVQSMVAS